MRLVLTFHILPAKQWSGPQYHVSEEHTARGSGDTLVQQTRTAEGHQVNRQSTSITKSLPYRMAHNGSPRCDGRSSRRFVPKSDRSAAVHNLSLAATGFLVLQCWRTAPALVVVLCLDGEPSDRNGSV